MTSKRLHFVLVVAVGVLLLGLAGGAYGINSLLTSRASQLTALKAKSMALSQEQVSLKQAQAEIKKYAGLQQIAQTVVPEDKKQAEATLEISNIANKNGVSLASITFPASTLGTLPTTATGAGSAAAPSAAALNNPKTTALSQLTPVKNIPGVYSLPITVQGDPANPVPYNKFVAFLHDLEHNRRTAQVTNISLQPKTDNRNLLTFTLTLNEYIKK